MIVVMFSNSTILKWDGVLLLIAFMTSTMIDNYVRNSKILCIVIFSESSNHLWHYGVAENKKTLWFTYKDIPTASLVMFFHSPDEFPYFQMKENQMRKTGYTTHFALKVRIRRLFGFWAI